ncbi:MAG: c-type cytochrome domain-containing protein, partial [Spirosomataceae bacterium]
MLFIGLLRLIRLLVQSSIAQPSSIIAAILVILTGHYGATLTHGTNFIVEPMTKNESVAFDKAMVFADVIQPIFEQKCVSCHNPDKTKGGLLLTNQQAILKGGKTGKLFVAGNPEISLLLQRIHLPLEEKKHMPPVGKPQLNPLEIKLLSLWIKGNADFTKKVMDLPANDSLRLIATTFLAPAVEKEESYDFAAADEKTIQKLQTAYRTIAPLAQESPALSVSFFNKNNFASQKLAELSEIKSQIVALNLPKMPVSDADLNTIATFENLQKLDLNFTDITGKGLKILTSLKKLQRLSVSGTKVTFGDLQPMIKNFGSLTTLTLWETSVSVDEIKQLQKANPSIEFIAGFRDDGSNPIKLNPPQVKNHSMVFKDSVLVQLAHPINGVDIRYTTDNSPPDSIHSLLFTGQTTLQKSATIRAKTYKTGWLGSDEVVFDFFKNTYKPDSLRLLLPLNRVHQAAGANTFFDGILGTFNA